MGSPIVFHTAPPQPASNARITCAPVFVGGPDASQKGFGDSSPQSFTRKSDMLHLANNSRTTHKEGRTISSGLNSQIADYFLPRGLPSQASIPRAAAIPSATASTTSLPALAQSPPAKYFA